MNETTLKVDGMTCPSCVRHIAGAIRSLDGIEDVDVRLRDGTVVVRHDATSAPLGSLLEAVRGAGYEARRAGE